jgi:hypothetical protein
MGDAAGLSQRRACRLAKRKATCCHGKPISLLHKRQYGLYVMFTNMKHPT